MSGGVWNYEEYHIRVIIDDLKSRLGKMGKKIPDGMSWYTKEWLEEHPEDGYYEDYDPEVKERIKEGIEYLKLAYIYVKRIDYLFSADDGEDMFLKKLARDIERKDNEDEIY